MKKVWGYNSTITGTCGVGVISSLTLRRPPGLPFGMDTLERLRNNGGCGWCIAGFINTPVCRDAYEILAEKYKIVFQSPIRMNWNSGNNFFFVMYDTKRAK